MKRTAIAVSMILTPSAAFAVDWSINTTETERVELNSNLFLATVPAGTLGSYTTLKADANARTPDSKFNFEADGTYTKYWGPGTQDVSQTEFTNWGFTAHYETPEKQKFDREFIEASWRQQSEALALLNELGISTRVDGALDRLTATGGIDRSLSARDTVSLLATATHTSFEPSSAGIPFTDTLARGTWRHSLSSITALNSSSEVELLDFNNTFNTNITILREQVGMEATLSSLLSFRGNVGAAYIVTNNGIGTSVGGSAQLAVSSTTIDWIGDAVLTYKMLKDTTLTLNMIQAIGPTIVGALFKRDSISGGLAYTINTSSTLSFLTGVNRQIFPGSTTDFLTASVTYGYNFTREWNAQLSYRYLHRFAVSGATTTIDAITNTPTISGTGPADSHAIIVAVTHKFTVLPSGN